MTNDLLGDTVKKMRDAHLMADNSVGIELFEFLESRMPKGVSRGYEGFFHICLIADDISGKRRSDIWNTWESVAFMKLTLPAFCFSSS
ncbi:hypothetical protein [Peribacillus sp. V2I11]|uniref:hypothetical protein n=1 Tax=Peribacillus sp. V2I11 TaxID=3042277 RepID=UPI002781A352|nr:hypothetical protein [Peribacillus sp. V2I11]MDQ0882994.1 hypothetical protein [Peribacillus sp. V2I11]